MNLVVLKRLELFVAFFVPRRLGRKFCPAIWPGLILFVHIYLVCLYLIKKHDLFRFYMAIKEGMKVGPDKVTTP